MDSTTHCSAVAPGRQNVAADGGMGLLEAASVPAPVVREEAPRSQCSLTLTPGPLPAPHEAASKRVRDVDAGNPSPPPKRMCMAGPSNAVRMAVPQFHSESALLAMPDDVLLQIVAALTSAEPVLALRTVLRIRASCPALRQRVAAPSPATVLNLKHQFSAREIRALLLDETLDAQQVQNQVRACCDRYGDVRVVLSSLASHARTFPRLRHRNHSVLAGIAASREIHSLQLDMSGAHDITISALCDALKKLAAARVSVTARNVNWGNGALTDLLDTVRDTKSIVSLAIGGSAGRSGSAFRFMEQGGWAPRTVQALDSLLRASPSMEMLELSANHPGDAALCAIAGSLAANGALTQLRLPENGLSKKGIRVLGQALGANSRLGTLDMHGNLLCTDGVRGLLDGLKKNRTLTALDLSRCLRGDALVLEMASLFEHNDTLRTLHLSCCGIGDLGLAGLAQGLCGNGNLQYLNLGNNPDLTATGITALASALKVHPAITSLDLRGIRIDSAGMEALASGLLENHPTLGLLQISDYPGEREVAKIVIDAMKGNTRLCTLVMGKRVYGATSLDND